MQSDWLPECQDCFPTDWYAIIVEFILQKQGGIRKLLCSAPQTQSLSGVTGSGRLELLRRAGGQGQFAYKTQQYTSEHRRTQKRRRQSVLMMAAASNNSAYDCKLHFRQTNMKPGQAPPPTLTMFSNACRAASIECTATLGSVQTLRVQERASRRIWQANDNVGESHATLQYDPTYNKVLRYRSWILVY